MENQLQEIKNQFTKELFEVVRNEMFINHNEDILVYYNLFIANLDKHNIILKDILQNGLARLEYSKENLEWFTDGEFTVHLNNKTQYIIKLIYQDSEYEEDAYIHRYNITKINVTEEILEEDIDKNLLEQTTKETENKLQQFRLQQKQDKLNQMLEDRKQLNLDIEELQKELSLAC